MPVISRSMATKSAARTWLRSSESTASKFDLVTFLRGKLEFEAVAGEETAAEEYVAVLVKQSSRVGAQRGRDRFIAESYGEFPSQRFKGKETRK